MDSPAVVFTMMIDTWVLHGHLLPSSKGATSAIVLPLCGKWVQNFWRASFKMGEHQFHVLSRAPKLFKNLKFALADKSLSGLTLFDDTTQERCALTIMSFVWMIAR
jgi:hypothetical protein